MASAELTIAKAALSGALFRADPRACTRDDIESMLALLDTAITECSPHNVQKFKHWSLSNLVPSSGRLGPFCKYLVALASSFGGDKDAVQNAKTGRTVSVKRRRLHILYILNDMLYHLMFHMRHGSPPASERLAAALAPTLPALVRSASSFANSPKHLGKIQDLLALWEEQGYFDPGFFEKLRAAVGGAPTSGGETQVADTTSSTAKTSKNAPFLMPALHGDLGTPWYDLPAGNWLPVMEPNSTRPMNPDMIKPLVLAPGLADKNLVEAVKKLLVDVDKIYTKEANLDDPLPDVGPMGEYIEADGLNGSMAGGDTYYGWSHAFCKRMRARKRGEIPGKREDNRRRTRSTSSSRSYSRSPSQGQPAFKRTRLSPSPRSRSRSRSHTRTRSRSRGRDDRSRGRDEGNRPKDPSYLKSRSRSFSRSRSPSRSRDRRYQPTSPKYDSTPPRRRSPSPPPSHTSMPPHPPSSGFMPLPPHMGFPGPPPPHASFGNFPVPPPPPPTNYHGQWPPPPPMMMGGPPPPNYYGGNAPPPFPGQWVGGGWGAPAPPPPPPQEQFYQGRGGGGSLRGAPGGRGGGYGRGGGGW